MESIYLSGSEDVRNAASTISSAADEMKRAASNLEYALQSHERFLDDWLARFQEVIESAGKDKNDD